MPRTPGQNIAMNEVLVFDWGNTLMKVFPEYDGPMSNWPQVAEVDGIVEALEGLLGHFSMAVATNAVDSQASHVWLALRRVGLGEYFKAVFTLNELGRKKPDLGFFRQLEVVLDRPPYKMVMIGDDYSSDVVGAKAAGWRAIWYNPEHRMAAGLMPLHDAEIDHLTRLPEAVRNIDLPDYPTCLAWLQEKQSPYNLILHLQLAAAIAYQLAAWLGAKGEPVDPVLAHRGGLLHDISKMDSLRAGRERGKRGDHAAMAAELLLQRGQPQLAEIADRHMLYQDPGDPRRPQTWEQKLVHFADKLAEGSRLVTLEERMQALKSRYPDAASELEAGWPHLQRLQDEICARLEVDAGELHRRLRESLGAITRQAS